jgi:hypothetical protein
MKVELLLLLFQLQLKNSKDYHYNKEIIIQQVKNQDKAHQIQQELNQLLLHFQQISVKFLVMIKLEELLHSPFHLQLPLFPKVMTKQEVLLLSQSHHQSNHLFNQFQLVTK